MALFNCSECGREISTDAKTCPGCGAKAKPPKPQKPPKKPTSPLLKVVFAATIATMIGMGIINHSEMKEAQEAEQKRNEVAMKAAADHREAEKRRIEGLTPEQREAEQKKKNNAVAASIINGGEAMLERRKHIDTWISGTIANKNLNQEWIDTKSRLGTITPEQAGYKKAQSLIAAMSEKEKTAAAEEAVFHKKAQQESRKSFASNLEQVFINRRMDVDVRAYGANNENLEIKWVLANKVFANDLSNSDTLEQAEKLGFKKVVLMDGYDHSWSWNLKPKG